MHSNFKYSLRRLPSGDVLLCDSEGDPICVDASGRIRLTQHGNVMTMKQWQREKAAEAKAELTKVALQDYRKVVEKLFRPRLNLRDQQIEINGIPITEEDFNNLHQRAAEDQGLKFGKEDLQSQIRSSARQAAYDPVAEWLKGLGVEGGPCLTDEEWDQIAVLAFGLTDSWSRKVLQKWLISAVARALEPGCKVDYCLMLHGGQGLAKSTFFDVMGGEYFSDSMGNLVNKKDDLAVLHQYWICEWSEVDLIFKGADKSEEVKRFVSSREDTFRAPYGRTTQRWPRKSILCGTTNRDDWANDPTGNRRFPVLSPSECNTDWLKENRERIFSRAVVSYRAGKPWWFTKEEEARITKEASRYAAANDDVEVAWTYLNECAGEWVSSKDLMLQALGRDPDKLKQHEVSAFTRVMSALIHRGALKEKRNYIGRTSHSPSRIKTICWMVPECNECNESVVSENPGN